MTQQTTDKVWQLLSISYTQSFRSTVTAIINHCGCIVIIYLGMSQLHHDLHEAVLARQTGI